MDPSIDMCSADYFGSGIESCGNDFKFRDEEKTISTEVNTQICPSKSLISYINIFKCIKIAFVMGMDGKTCVDFDVNKLLLLEFRLKFKLIRKKTKKYSEAHVINGIRKGFGNS